MAATGNIGSRVARAVAAQGATPVLISRTRAKLEQLGIVGAEIAEADISDPAALVAATRGTDALFWVVPATGAEGTLAEWYQRITAAGVAAVAQNGIRRVVLISSLGAGSAPNLGTVSYVGQSELAFDALAAHVLALRPGYFMENLLLQAERLRTAGTVGFAYAPDHDIPFVSVDDIGDLAARYLLDATWAGHWQRNIMGPENSTLPQVADRLTTALGRPIRYEQATLAATNAELTSWGVSAPVRQELLDLFRALGDPDGIYATPRTAEAYSPTSLEQFISRKLLPMLHP